MSPAHLTPGHQLNRAFSACYCYLLCTLDDAWHDTRIAKDPVLRNKLVRSMHPLMMDVLTPLAGVIVQQDFGAGTAGLGIASLVRDTMVAAGRAQDASDAYSRFWSIGINGLYLEGQPELLDQAKVGILAGSLVSGLVGAAILRLTRRIDAEAPVDERLAASA